MRIQMVAMVEVQASFNPRIGQDLISNMTGIPQLDISNTPVQILHSKSEDIRS